MEGRLRANMLWDSIVLYKTERGAMGSKTGYPRLTEMNFQRVFECENAWSGRADARNQIRKERF
jgi:hypothetical protein